MQEYKCDFFFGDPSVQCLMMVLRAMIHLLDLSASHWQAYHAPIFFKISSTIEVSSIYS